MKKEALEVMKNRRAIRQFKAQQVSNEDLNAVLAAGTYAPTAAGTQAPVIVAVQNPDDVAKLNATYAVGLGSCWIHRSKEMFETKEGKELLKKWGLPETMRSVCSIALGYPDCPHPEAPACKSDYIVRV